MNIIQLKAKSVYGNELLYPVNHTAELWCELAGTKTFTYSMEVIAKQHGYTIEKS